MTSSKRTLNQAVGKLKNQASLLGLGEAIVEPLFSKVYVTFARRICFCVCDHKPTLLPPNTIFVNYRDDSSMKSAIEELKKAAAQT